MDSQIFTNQHHDGRSSKQEGSLTQVFNESYSKPKPRQRLTIKKSSAVEEVLLDLVRDDDSGRGEKRKKLSGRGESSKKREKKLSFCDFIENNSRKRPKSTVPSGDNAAEVKEMWDTVVGGDLEEPKKSNEDDVIKEIVSMGTKRKNIEKSGLEIAMVVESVMAEFEVAAEEDADLNRASKPAIKKLIKLPRLIEALSKKLLQPEFLDHGILTLLKNWLEPLPDNSLPNINIRAAILKILTEFPIDLSQYDRREQLKKSGIGNVVMFLSKLDEETESNRKLAKDLVDKWSRGILNISTRFQDMSNIDDSRIPIRPLAIKRPMNKVSGLQYRGDELDLAKYSQEPKSKCLSDRLHISIPEPMPLNFVVRPESKTGPYKVDRAPQVILGVPEELGECRYKIYKKSRQFSKKKQLQFIKLSVEGRGMVNYL